MSGLEVLSAVAAATELVRVLHTCLQFLNQIRKGFKYTVEQRGLHLQLVVQAIQFERWCDTINVAEVIQLTESDPKGWQQGIVFVEFQRRLTSNLRFGNSGIAQLVIQTVRDLSQKFEEACNILKGYSAPVKVNGNGNAIEPKQDDQLKSKKRWYKFNRPPSAQQGRVEDEQPDSSTSKKVVDAMRWGTTDKKSFQRLLDEIVAINTSLLTLLQLDQQKRVERQAILGVLHDTSQDTLAINDLPQGSELQTLANIRNIQDGDQKGLATIPEAAKSYRSRVYHSDDFGDQLIKLSKRRCLAEVDQERVLVEWKYYSKEKPVRTDRSLRLSNLVGLLNHHDLHTKFLTPRCKGLVSDDTNARIGIIFDVPATIPQSNPLLQTHELQSFIRTSREIPSLGERFAMAKRLASAMHHLHSVHWLHKSFRSDNIIFFENPGELVESSNTLTTQSTRSTDKFESGPVKTVTPAPAPLPKFYLVGWDLSRPDHPSELSESLSNPRNGFQNDRENSKLYSHPETQLSASSTGRVRYRAQFDIYSLGLVLLEIGLWRTLDTIRKKCDNDQQFRKKVSSEYCDNLLPKMGEIYWRATQRCIANDFDLQPASSDADGVYSLQIAFERQVVAQLEKCSA